MNPGTDRIPVPTNGQGPHELDEPPTGPEATSSDDVAVGFTPTQLAIGFGILASLIVVVVRQLRRRQGRGRFGRR